jgi:hypothetical protein
MTMDPSVALHGVEGVGEIGVVGAAAAISNAIIAQPGPAFATFRHRWRQCCEPAAGSRGLSGYAGSFPRSRPVSC